MNTVDIRALLQTIKYPGFSRDIVSFGLVQSVEVRTDAILIKLAITTANPEIPVQIRQAIESAIESVSQGRLLQLDMHIDAPKHGASTTPTVAQTLKNVTTIIAIASGKGGVGKSTFAVNFACALEQLLSQRGRSQKVGLMDCDIYGPSIPLMMGIQSQPEVVGDHLQPLNHFGLKLMSMGFLIDSDTPVVWRGPMVTKTIQQFISNVDWGALDILIVDLPPGTGDAHLSLVQNLTLRGAIIVTTPQPVASSITCKGAMMFSKVNVPILGVIENMSYFVDATTGEHQPIFGSGGGHACAQALNTHVLAHIPLEPLIRISGDNGIPVTLSHPNHPVSKIIYDSAQAILQTLESLNV